MALATLTDIKTLMGISGSAVDAKLTLLLGQATAIAERLTGRALEREVARVEYPVALPWQSRFCRLQVFPIESVTSVKQLYAVASDAEFAAEDPLTENDDFVIDAVGGVLERINAVWHTQRRWLQVIYTAGYIDPSTASPPAGSFQPPADLQFGVQQQVIRMFQTADSAGVRETDLGDAGGRISFAEAKVHPALKEACDALRRMHI
jgi:hypothetical protein